MNESPPAQDDAWVARLIAWAEEFQISEKDLPRSRDALLSLQELDLSHDFDSPVPKITWLPPEIGQLQQLQQLQLDSNRLTTLPPEIGQLQQLQKLSPGGNRLTTLPPEIGKLRQLQQLNLRENQLTTLPPEIAQL